VSNEHGVAVSTECFVESDRIGNHGAGMNMVAVCRDLRGRKPSIEWGHRPVAGLGEFGKEITVSIGRVREPMQAKRQRSLAHLQVVKSQPVGSYITCLELLH
jgi:hypothetical protein